MKLLDYVKQGETGGQSRLAKALGLSSTVLVSQWANGVRDVPFDRCVAIEVATGGQVTRKDLRPDDWQKVWPELEEAA